MQETADISRNLEIGEDISSIDLFFQKYIFYKMIFDSVTLDLSPLSSFIFRALELLLSVFLMKVTREKRFLNPHIIGYYFQIVEES